MLLARQVSDGVVTPSRPKGLKAEGVSKRKVCKMINARQIVLLIQQIPAESSCMRFLVSLADSAFKYGTLTEKQEIAFNNCLNGLKSKGVLA